MTHELFGLTTFTFIPEMDLGKNLKVWLLWWLLLILPLWYSFAIASTHS